MTTHPYQATEKRKHLPQEVLIRNTEGRRERQTPRDAERETSKERRKREPQKRQLKPEAEIRTGKGSNLQLSVSFVSGSHVGALLYLA